jgi:hypothetical protein
MSEVSKNLRNYASSDVRDWWNIIVAGADEIDRLEAVNASLQRQVIDMAMGNTEICRTHSYELQGQYLLNDQLRRQSKKVLSMWEQDAQLCEALVEALKETVLRVDSTTRSKIVPLLDEWENRQK